jgi:hypothetical protein
MAPGFTEMVKFCAKHYGRSSCFINGPFSSIFHSKKKLVDWSVFFGGDGNQQKLGDFTTIRSSFSTADFTMAGFRKMTNDIHGWLEQQTTAGWWCIFSHLEK